MKRTFFFVIIFISGIIVGMLMYKNNWFPFSVYRDYRSEIESESHFRLPYGVFYLPYSFGVPLFSDRNYYDIIGNKKFENSHVIQLPRHYNNPIKIELTRPAIVYRILSNVNDNSIFEDWELLDIEVSVKGNSCVHSIVVCKLFNSGMVTLPSGGPNTSSPIIIKNISNNPIKSLIINGVKMDDSCGLTNFAIENENL